MNIFKKSKLFIQVGIANAPSLLKGIVTGRNGGALVEGVSRARSIESDMEVPSHTDVVVIGGGIIGCLTALELVERGKKVILCDKGVIAGESSGRALGVIESQFLDPSKFEIVMRSKKLWSQMNERIKGETGYRKSGMAALFADEGFMGFAQEWHEAFKDSPDIDAEMVDSQTAAEIAGKASCDYVGGLNQDSDAMIEPQLAAPAIAEAIRKLGGIVLQQCAVRGIEKEGGKVSAVVTEGGKIICQSVVLAGGAWSPVFMKSLGLDLPQFMAFSCVTRLSNFDGPIKPILEGGHGLVMRPTIDGHYDICKPLASVPVTPNIIANMTKLAAANEHMADQLEPVWNFSTFMKFWLMPSKWDLSKLSPFEKTRILSPEIRHNMLDEITENIAQTFPGSKNAKTLERWSGILTSTPDNMPVISAIDEIPGLFVGSGFYFGMTMAPATGEALADLVMGEDPKIDLSLYRYSRFTDGSELVFRY